MGMSEGRESNAVAIDLVYTIPNNIKDYDIIILDIQHFVSQFNLNAEALRPAIAERWSSLTSLFAQFLNIELPEELLSAAAAPLNDEEQRYVNLINIFRKMELNWSDKVDIAWLESIHLQLCYRLSNPTTPGRVRTADNSLFGNIVLDDTLPHGQLMIKALSIIISECNKVKIHPIIRSLFMYYAIRLIHPFSEENELIAMLAGKQILANTGQDFSGLLPIEHHVYFNAELEEWLIQLSALPYANKNAIDLSIYLEMGIRLMTPALHQVSNLYRNTVAKQLTVDADLNPREKNAINFWLQEGYKIHSEHVSFLTDRQREIINSLVRYGSLSIAELVPIMNSDRNSLQRDMDALVDNRIARPRGHGRELIYMLDMKISLG